MLDGRAGPGGETLHVVLSYPPVVYPNRILWRKVVVVMEKRRASRISGEGLGLGLGRVRKNKKIGRVLNVERVEGARTCLSWSEGGCGDGG